MMAKVVSSLGPWPLAFQLSFTKSRSHTVLYLCFVGGNNSNMSDIKNLYPTVLSINSLFLRRKCEWTLDINVDLHASVIYRAGFSPYQVLREWNHSVMLEPNIIQVTAVEILSEWSLLSFFACFSTELWPWCFFQYHKWIPEFKLLLFINFSEQKFGIENLFFFF